ncbi:MAG TPA: hypothetical protein DIW26_08695 [Ruminococcus sp.]|nr:hypothetical protein [Ruminococcus sp.]
MHFRAVCICKISLFFLPLKLNIIYNENKRSEGVVKLNNFDDASKKYKDEIIKLYKNQNSDYDMESYMSMFPEAVPEPSAEELENNSEEIAETSFPQVMPPAVAEQSPVYNENLENNMGTGFLRVEATSADRAYPAENALVIITEIKNGRENILYIFETDKNGSSPIAELPAPVFSGGEISDKKPFSYYNVLVYAKGFYEVQNKNVAVFNGITSILPVNLIPVPAYTEEKRTVSFYGQETDL